MTVAQMYVTLMPVLLTGVANMALMKMPLMKRLKVPLDGGRVMKDGKRIFGDNKTVKGFVGYVLCGIACSEVWGGVCAIAQELGKQNCLYTHQDNTFWFNFLTGAVFGLAYALFELPNSFLKRRLDVKPGKNAGGVKGVLCFILDQIDSIVGCTLALMLFCRLTPTDFAAYILLGAVTHIAVNIILYICKLRKNIF